MPYERREFVERVAGHGLKDLIAATETEIYDTEGESFGVDGPTAQAQGNLQYTAFLKGLLSFLYHDKRPHGLSDDEMKLLRSIAQALVETGEKESKALEALE